MRLPGSGSYRSPPEATAADTDPLGSWYYSLLDYLPEGPNSDREHTNTSIRIRTVEEFWSIINTTLASNAETEAVLGIFPQKTCQIRDSIQLLILSNFRPDEASRREKSPYLNARCMYSYEAHVGIFLQFLPS